MRHLPPPGLRTRGSRPSSAHTLRLFHRVITRRATLRNRYRLGRRIRRPSARADDASIDCDQVRSQAAGRVDGRRAPGARHRQPGCQVHDSLIQLLTPPPPANRDAGGDQAAGNDADRLALVTGEAAESCSNGQLLEVLAVAVVPGWVAAATTRRLAVASAAAGPAPLVRRRSMPRARSRAPGEIGGVCAMAPILALATFRDDYLSPLHTEWAQPYVEGKGSLIGSPH